jgi:threonine/homoserine/homoserine lactone efflux protein
MTWEQVATAFGLGFALGAAPGPVQLLILSETSRRGLAGGLRVMLGANGTLLVVMVVLALGFSSVQPGPGVLRTLRVVGGAWVIYLGAVELRNLRSPAVAERADARRELGPTAKGIMSVVISPGAWVFFGTTASAVVIDATAEGGQMAALAAGLAMAVGVSTSDLSFTLLGSGGRALLGDRGLTWLRSGLAVGLMAIGVLFMVQGVVN